jgi:hypothetical protein
LKNWIKKMEGNSTTPKNCVLTNFLDERSTIFFLVFSQIRFWIFVRNVLSYCFYKSDKIKECIERRHGEPLKFLHLPKMGLLGSQASTRKKNPIMNYELHCKFLPHENYGDWELRGPCRENLHYLWKRAVRFAGKPLFHR